MIEKLVSMLRDAVDGQVLAAFHHIVKECFKRQTISKRYMIRYIEGRVDDSGVNHYDNS